jgi:hypothetical protein
MNVCVGSNADLADVPSAAPVPPNVALSGGVLACRPTSTLS